MRVIKVGWREELSFSSDDLISAESKEVRGGGCFESRKV